jgi:hypothetical protein
VTLLPTTVFELPIVSSTIRRRLLLWLWKGERRLFAQAIAIGASGTLPPLWWRPRLRHWKRKTKKNIDFGMWTFNLLYFFTFN